MPRILMLHPHDIRYFPWTIRIVKFAEILAQRGYEVTLAHPSVREEDVALLQRKPIFHPDGNCPFQVIRLEPRQRNLRANLDRVVALARDADILHVQKCHAGTMLPALFASRKWGIPIHYDWDDNESAIVLDAWHGHPRGFVRMTRFYERRVHRYADSVSVASRGIREIARGWGVPEEIMVEAPVGADLTAYSPAIDGSPVRRSGDRPVGDHPLVLYLGQLEGAAYGELFLKTACIVGEKHPETRFMMVGGGALLKDLQRKAGKWGLGETMTFPGYIPREQVPVYVAAADIAVACFEDNPITRCKSPLKIAEYLAAGKAIAASNVGEVPRMLGDCGFLAEPGSAVSLAEGIVRYLRDPDLRTRHARMARKRAEEVYNWERTVDRLEEGYRRILAESGAAGPARSNR